MQRRVSLRRKSKKRAALDRKVPEDYLALVAMLDRCEWCNRHRPLSPHHVAQGFRDKTLYDIRLITFLCPECHRDIHREVAENGRALGLALIYHASRGNNVWWLYHVTGREWPDKKLVDLWIDRVCRTRFGN
jgi:hypothetical protein